MRSVIGTAPGPENFPLSAASAGVSRMPVPIAPIPTPPINPRRETPFLGFFGLMRHRPFIGSETSQLYQMSGGATTDYAVTQCPNSSLLNLVAAWEKVLTH